MSAEFLKEVINHDKSKLLFSYFIVFIRNGNNSDVYTIDDDALYVILNEFYNIYCGGKVPTTANYKKFKGSIELQNGRRIIKIDPDQGIMYIVVDGKRKVILSDQMRICFQLSIVKDKNGDEKYDTHAAINHACKHYHGHEMVFD